MNRFPVVSCRPSENLSVRLRVPRRPDGSFHIICAHRVQNADCPFLSRLCLGCGVHHLRRAHCTPLISLVFMPMGVASIAVLQRVAPAHAMHRVRMHAITRLRCTLVCSMCFPPSRCGLHTLLYSALCVEPSP
ncbi:hypothetical protein TRVL_07774 [Trypanosoma vivax]|nr:hypothetical protein TRVL_07774 [Trypanosoma vivax]